MNRLEEYNPTDYGKTRNYIDGNVSYLSPYISRGVLSTKQVYEFIKAKELGSSTSFKFIQELAWRDYWQVLWNHYGSAINSDLKRDQPGLNRDGIATAILNAATGIHQIDLGIQSLYENGYMHNHMRMYVASIAANLASCHWYEPAKWMHYHLLDADWASNALSWQWVAGSNSSKKYVANQWNINTFTKSVQHNTWLDVAYEDFDTWIIPDVLKNVERRTFKTQLPKPSEIELKPNKNTALYTFYNLDPLWKKKEEMNRILILEPSFFKQFPISEKVLDFTLNLAGNIPGIQLFVGEFSEFKPLLGSGVLYYKQHPTNNHFEGVEESRDWLTTVTKPYPSFFGFWKQVQKELFR